LRSPKTSAALFAKAIMRSRSARCYLILTQSEKLLYANSLCLSKDEKNKMEEKEEKLIHSAFVEVQIVSLNLT